MIDGQPIDVIEESKSNVNRDREAAIEPREKPRHGFACRWVAARFRSNRVMPSERIRWNRFGSVTLWAASTKLTCSPASPMRRIGAGPVNPGKRQFFNGLVNTIQLASLAAGLGS
jgi:hypothetical protein